MSTTRETIDNRERILVAAEELFAQQGFAATSVREIVQRAEVTAPVLYYYFGSKDDLLRIMIEQRFQEFLERTTEGMKAAPDLRGVIASWVEALLQDSVDHPTTLRLILSSVWGQPVPHVRQLIFRYHFEMTEIFVECVHRFLPDVDYYRVRFAMSALHGLLNSFTFPMLHGCEIDDLSEVRDSIIPRIEMLLRDDLPVPSETMKALESYARTIADEPALPSGKAP